MNAPPPSQRLSPGNKVRLYSLALLAALSVVQLLPEQSVLLSLAMEPIEVDPAPPTAKRLETEEQKKQAKHNSGAPFNYTAFWENVRDKAMQSLEKETTSPPSPCPKVYVYNLTEFNKIDNTEKHPRQFANAATLKGKDRMYRGYLHKTNQYAFASILEERLVHSKQCRTHNPDQADLFFAPILSAPKGNRGWTITCQAITGEMVRDALPYLNSTNACRHFFAVGKGHTDLPHCNGWFANPIEELIPFARLAYSSVNFRLDKHGGHWYLKNDTVTTTHPNMVSVPYPSSLHFTSNGTIPHFDQVPRKALMSFIGKDNHGDTKVRTRIHKLCKQYKDDKICDWRARYVAEVDATSKARTVFCLEPAGDTPGRKSLSDSITFGCIPVLFSELTDDVAPWHWKDWKDRARIVVPRKEFLTGQVDLKTLLQSMPSDLLQLMQQTLKEKARKFQYSLDDDQEDGVRVILDNLKREAEDKVNRGVCGFVE